MSNMKRIATVPKLAWRWYDRQGVPNACHRGVVVDDDELQIGNQGFDRLRFYGHLPPLRFETSCTWLPGSESAILTLGDERELLYISRSASTRSQNRDDAHKAEPKISRRPDRECCKFRVSGFQIRVVCEIRRPPLVSVPFWTAPEYSGLKDPHAPTFARKMP
jgi:hypothetical protein